MQKPKTFLLLTLAAFFLCGCNAGQGGHITSSEETSQGSSVDGSSQAKEPQTYNFYCINDFHGSILEQRADFYEVGLEKMMGKLKDLKEKDPEHTFIFSAGDMWQGSYESNSNYGNLITKAMNESFDAMCLGNHEFDYGQERIFANIELADFPILAGNIMKWDNGPTSESWGKTQISTTIERGGIKLGVVGMIGEGQTTSITSSNVQDIVFVNPEQLAENEAERLRRDEGCDAVILLLHADASSIIGSRGSSGWENVENIGTYFDGIFTGHSHSRNLEYVDEIPMVQSYSNGSAVSHFSVTIGGGQNVSSQGDIMYTDSRWPTSQNAVALCDEYIRNETFLGRSSAVAGTIDSSLSKTTVSEFACKAIYEKYSKDYEIVTAMQNTQRSSVLNGQVLYSDLYKAMPFTNKIVIMEVSGRELLLEGGYNPTYTADTVTYAKDAISANGRYKIAVIDYLAYHQNSEKSYNYFSGLNTGQDKIIAEFEDYPVDIAFDYMASLEGEIHTSDYTGIENGYSIYMQ